MAYQGTIFGWNCLVDAILGYPQAERLEEIIGLAATKRFEEVPTNLIFSGGPRTGKSTILDLIAAIIPTDVIYSTGGFALDAKNNGTLNKIHIIHDFDYVTYLKEGGKEVKYGDGPIIFGATNQHPEKFIGIMPYGSTWMQMTGHTLSKVQYCELRREIINDPLSIRLYCGRKVIPDYDVQNFDVNTYQYFKRGWFTRKEGE